MRQIIMLVLVSVFPLAANSQSIPEKEIIGKWNVKTIVTQSGPEDIALGFAHSTFSFTADHTFQLSTTRDSKVFQLLTQKFNGKKWMVKPGAIIAIGTPADNYSLMRIKYETKNGGVIFTLEETPYQFGMQKQ